MKFKLTAINEEYLPTIEIEAETIEQAKVQFIERWEQGNIPVSNSELRVFEMENDIATKEI